MIHRRKCVDSKKSLPLTHRETFHKFNVLSRRENQNWADKPLKTLKMFFMSSFTLSSLSFVVWLSFSRIHLLPSQPVSFAWNSLRVISIDFFFINFEWKVQFAKFSSCRFRWVNRKLAVEANHCAGVVLGIKLLILTLFCPSKRFSLSTALYITHFLSCTMHFTQIKKNCAQH